MPKALGKRRLPDFREQILQGLRLETENRLEEAERLYAAVLQQDAGHSLALYRLAIFRAKQGDDIEALRLIQAAMKRTVTAEVVADCAVILDRLKRPEEALAAYDRALALSPNNTLALLHRGKLFTHFGEYGKAAQSFDRLLSIHPDHAEAHNARGHMLIQLARHREAIECFRRTIALEPENGNAHFNLALALLVSGDYESGWEEYEWRFRTEGLANSRSVYPQRHWDGVESLNGKTILLYTEQGMGDSIMFLRYAPLLAAQGAKVIVGVLPPVKVLMSGIDGIRALTPGDPLPRFDLQCALLSLPYLLKNRLETIPADVPYIRASAEKMALWKDRVPQGGKPTVGVVWAGGRDFKGDKARSIGLDQFESIFNIPGVDFVCLQRDLREGDAERLIRRPNVLPLGAQFNDFGDTAAVMSMLDLVISVDTSVAHLAGALGKPVWILIPLVPDFRWMLNRTDSPWYPTAQLFRQTTVNEWIGVLSNVKTALSGFCGNSPVGSRTGG